MNALNKPSIPGSHQPDSNLFTARETSRARRGFGAISRKQNLTTVSIEDATIRVVTFEGNRIVEWATGYQSLHNKNGGPIWGASELRTELKNVIAAAGGTKGRVIIDVPFSAEIVVDIALPRARNRLLREMAESEFIEKTAIPRNEIDIYSSELETPDPDIDNKHVRLRTIGVPNRVTDQRISDLLAVGVRPALAFGQAGAVASVFGPGNGAIVHLERTIVWIVHVVDGMMGEVSQIPVFRDPFDDMESSTISAITRAVERYAVRNDADPTRAEDQPFVVQLFGEFAGQAGLVESLSAKSISVGTPADNRFEFPAGFDPAEYAINIGLAIAASPHKNQTALLRPANLIPERHRPRQFPWRRFGILAVLILLAIAEGMTAAYQGSRTAQAQDLEAQLSDLHRAERAIQLEENIDSATRVTITQTQNMTELLTEEITASREQVDDFRQRASVLLDEATIRGVILTDMTMTVDSIVLSGITQGPSTAVEYAAALRLSGLFIDIDLSWLEASDKSAAFRLRAIVRDGNLEKAQMP